MSCIALASSLILFLRPSAWSKLILPLVAFAAGSLIGGALLHMIPAAVEAMGNVTALYVWLTAGFILFFALEEFLNWHHSHTHSHSCGPLSRPHEHTKTFQQANDRSATHMDGLDCEMDCNNERNIECFDENHESTGQSTNGRCGDGDSMPNLENDPENAESCHHQQEHARRKPLTYLILVADTVHNFLGGLFVGASFVDSVELGVSAWLAAAAHEVPQELGDCAVLVHGGWPKYQALLFNFLSSLTFVIGSIIAYAASERVNVSFLVPFAAGNFLYIGGSDLIPEVKHFHGIKANLVQFVSFVIGVGIMLGIRVAVEGW